MKNSILIQVGNPPPKSAQTADLAAFTQRQFFDLWCLPEGYFFAIA
ncbi:hypothetical protein [Agrobacterium tumefaciens]|nr:hypothetical protein [Agrobacterium tumefaciens]UXT99417.1 hypothetical protein FY129_18175 [Agrobacterium tumefaciens]